MSSIKSLAEEWLRIDKDPTTSQEIQELLSAGDHEALTKRLVGRISFGTAGLRARMEAGFTRMNSLTVIQASQGLAAHLLATQPDAASKGVVIGRDARHNSEKFAKYAAAAFISHGIKVWWFEVPVHTPLVPFAISELDAAAGVMVTASHNPAQDNGYKVYWSNGCQIIPPHDRGIAEVIQENLEPVSWDLDFLSGNQNMHENILERVETAYYQRVESLVNSAHSSSLPPFVYTPMHGVGLIYMTKMINTITHQPVSSSSQDSRGFIVVSEQGQPDPDFPTVRFPNPEEAGALNLAMATADKHSVNLIIATDPDADRLAVAEKLPSGQWHQYTGNQVGILLASYVLDMYPTENRSKLAMLCSTVSSGMLSAMATSDGFQFVETLTGFKWLGNVAQSLAKDKGWDVPFAYEEALGYMFTAVAHDKDGISAAAVFLTAAEKWMKENEQSPWDRLQQLYEKYGHFADANTYLTSPNPTVTDVVFAHIRVGSKPPGRETAPQHPTHIGNKKILRWRDLTVGFDSATPNNVPDLPVDKASQMITCDVEGGIRFTVRGSGTEPKIKLYIEARADTMQEARKNALAMQQTLVQEWFRPEEYGLKLA